MTSEQFIEWWADEMLKQLIEAVEKPKTNKL